MRKGTWYIEKRKAYILLEKDMKNEVDQKKRNLVEKKYRLVISKSGIGGTRWLRGGKRG